MKNQDEVNHASRATIPVEQKKNIGSAKTNNGEKNESSHSKGDKKGKLTKATPLADGCLKCGGGHWMSSCPKNPSQEEKEKLIAEMKNKKALEKSSDVSTNSNKRITKTALNDSEEVLIGSSVQDAATELYWTAASIVLTYLVSYSKRSWRQLHKIYCLPYSGRIC